MSSKSSHRSDRQMPSSSASTSRNANGHPPVRSKVSPAKRSAVTNARASSSKADDEEPGRVRVAVRLRPRNAEDLLSDSDFADCVELQPEMKRLKLRKNNWNSDSYKFDEVFTESASQKRVYEVVAKPVVESVLNGYNGTVMAYGQTGTGKTYTVGRLGKEGTSERGIMVRALEDIISNTSPAFDVVEISYLQLYLESIQDLLAPEKNNIPIVEDPKTGGVSLPGATVIKIRDLDHFQHLLQIGETNRHAANTKMNTESSRSHAILMVFVQRPAQGKVENELSSQESECGSDLASGNGVPTLLKSKLLIVDLAGSERIDKSGSNGHLLEEAKFINLSLTSLGKCINALAEKSPHIPTRDSKLTRLLRDSFGGSSRTSLIITIGPSARHHAETASTIMFGQRAMKVVNMVKLKEEVDYESFCRKLENQVDYHTAEIEKLQKLRDDDKKEMEKKLTDCQNSFAEAEKTITARSDLLKDENTLLESEIRSLLEELKLQKERNDLMSATVAHLEMSLNQCKKNEVEDFTYQKALMDTTHMYEKKILELTGRLEDEHACAESAHEQLAIAKKLIEGQKEIDELRMKLQEMYQLHEKTVNEFQSLRTENEELLSEKIEGQKEIDELRMKSQEICLLHQKTVDEFQCMRTENEKLLSEKVTLSEELHMARQKLYAEEQQRQYLEAELVKSKKFVPDNDIDFEEKKPYMEENKGRATFGQRHKSSQSQETIYGQRTTITKICEEVGLQKILDLLRSEDLDVQIQALKVVANLAAEDLNQEKIVEEGGLDALLMLVGSSQNTTIQRVASGAIANLAMSETNQGLIMKKGGGRLLADVASRTDDPQTLRMVAGAFANLCGNERLHAMLKEDGSIKALMGMVKSGNSDVIAQVARGMANFSKCESRRIIEGQRKGRSLLIVEGVLTWLISNSTNCPPSTRRHIELALCHLAQNEDNAQDFISTGALKELICISNESSREDIRNLAKKTLKLSPTFQAKLQKV
ncbi:kinesin-like protein KIN-UC isoform X1 [Telopea speciosissima]|uniref:kinesin-like protein KIN-UC isoform X1 n=1 Tax=Telopea speciosissima TaxID=54955 RepID=UPI001CC79E41|nr:kinesin-like protein KIN-UC isoform X1 [Telopea speciosissima]